jgi:hypothetical protein
LREGRHDRPAATSFAAAMKKERFDYIYLLFGMLFGFLLGSSIGQESAIIARRMVFAAAIMFIAFSWRRIEWKAHNQHLEEWDEIEARGIWHFILVRYVLVRGVVLTVLLIGPALSTLQFSLTVVAFLAIAASLLIAILLFLGREEWRDCEQEMQILALRQTGEFIASNKN